MASRAEVQEKIKSLQLARTLLNAKIESLELAGRQIDQEIASLTGSLNQSSQVIHENPFLSDPATHDIAEFFLSKEFLIVSHSPLVKEKSTIAKRAWACYDKINPLFKQLAQARQKFQYCFPDDEQHAGKSTFFQLIKTIQEQGLIGVERKKNELTITPRKNADWSNFFDGVWVEYVGRWLIEDAVKKFNQKNSPLHYGIWSNVKLKKLDSPQTVDKELDIVLNLRDTAKINHHIYIFEIKSGKNLDIEGWVESTRLFQNESKNIRFITCSTNSSLDPMSFAPFRLCLFQNLPNLMADILSRDFPPPREK